MSHATSAEPHDHVYGFRRSSHVEACAACLAVAGTLEAERQAIRAALDEEPAEAPRELMAGLAARRLRRRTHPARVTLSVTGLTAAAALLAGLAWLLFHDRSRSTPATASFQSESDPVGRLIRELKSGSAARRDMAAFALRAFGEAASAPLKDAGIAPEPILSGRDATEEDRDLAAQLRSKRVTLDMQNAPLTDIAQFIQDFIGITLSIDRKSIPKPEEEIISIKVQDIVADGALKLLLQPRGYRHTLRGRTIIIYRGDSPLWIPPARAPVRFGAAPDDLHGAIRDLGSDAVEDREAATTRLARLGFAAEPALWETLDSAVPEARSRAADLLRRLYTPADAPLRVSESLRRALSLPVNVKVENGTLAEVLKSISDAGGISILVDPRLAASPPNLNLNIQRMDIHNTLQFLLEQVRLQRVLVGDWVLITDRASIVRTDPRDPIWLAPADARTLEELVAGLASPDPARRRNAEDSVAGLASRLGPAVYRVLIQASSVLETTSARRCLDAARTAATKSGVWLYDLSSGAELQRWTAAQKDLFEKKVDLDLDGETLARALERLGVTATFKSSPAGKLSGSLRGMKQVDFLKIATRLNGLDFTVGGETVVIDAAPGK